MGYYLNMEAKIYLKTCKCEHNNCNLQLLNPDVKTHKAKVICTCGAYIKFANEEDKELLSLG